MAVVLVHTIERTGICWWLEFAGLSISLGGYLFSRIMLSGGLLAWNRLL
jgi:hypothetical protein